MLLLNSKSNTILSDGELTQDGGIDAAIIREERRGSFSSMHVFKITERTRSTSQKRPLPSGRFFGSFFLPAARREKSVSSLDRRRRSPSSLPLPPDPQTPSLQKCNRTIERSRRIGREENGPAMAMRATGRPLGYQFLRGSPRGPVRVCTHTHERTPTHTGARAYTRRITHARRRCARERAQCTHILSYLRAYART